MFMVFFLYYLIFLRPYLQGEIYRPLFKYEFKSLRNSILSLQSSSRFRFIFLKLAIFVLRNTGDLSIILQSTFYQGCIEAFFQLNLTTTRWLMNKFLINQLFFGWFTIKLLSLYEVSKGGHLNQVYPIQL